MGEISVELFPARGGDCILVTFEAIGYRILIDGGFRETFKDSVLPELQKLAAEGKRIDLLVVTHVDNDHIMGIIELVKLLKRGKLEIEIGEIWYNGYRHLFQGGKKSLDRVLELAVLEEVQKLPNPTDGDILGKDIGYAQGETLAGLLSGIWDEKWNASFGGNAVCHQGASWMPLCQGRLYVMVLNPGPAELKMLEKKWTDFRRKKFLPLDNGESVQYEDCFEQFLYYSQEGEEGRSEQDMSATNRSSIAFLLKYIGEGGKEYQLLFSGDAPCSCFLDRMQGWDKIVFDCFKLPHHGSGKNIFQKDLEMLRVDNLLISTDGQRHHHPDWEVVSTAAGSLRCEKLIFNYGICEAVSRLKREFPEKKISGGQEGYYRIDIE
jgi:beta-lactamase superfamily II metal-dependent hydrolase|nr:MBL fold metallo-hydrolase [uncultured Acetatifactor sp.]